MKALLRLGFRAPSAQSCRFRRVGLARSETVRDASHTVRGAVWGSTHGRDESPASDLRSFWS